MKRFWLLGWMLALSAAVLTAPGTVRADDDMEAMNEGMGALSKRVGDIEKTLGLKISGDVRVRYEYFLQDQDFSTTGVTTVGNTFSDRGRARFRVRLALDKAFGDDFTAGVRLASGSTVEPTSTNQTMGGDAELKFIGIDRAFISWAPGLFDHKVKFIGGRMANPLTFSPITWDDDVTPEGAAFDATITADTHLRGLYFILNENGVKTGATKTMQAADPFLTVLQLEQAFRVSEVEGSLMVGYEWMQYVSGFLNPVPGTYNGPGAGFATTAWSVNGNFMVGNAVIGGRIPDLAVVDGLLRLKHKIGEEKIPVTWTFAGAYNTNSFDITPLTVTNTAFKGPAYTASNAVAMFGQLAVGKVASAGDFAGSVEFGYIEPNAVLSLFSDSDSGAGYNNEVWVKGVLEAGLWDNVSFKLSQYAVWRQNYDVFGAAPNATMGGTTQQPLFRTQIDLVAKL